MTAAALIAAAPVGAAGPKRTSGYYDGNVIEYTLSTAQTDSPAEAQQASKGLRVYHVVDSDRNTPAVQCDDVQATFPDDGTACNVINRIPTEKGYTGGSWLLVIFKWNDGVTPRALESDDEILAAAAAGEGTLTETTMLVRCPVVNAPRKQG